MAHETALDLRRADAIAGGFEHVVDTALIPEITVSVAPREIAGAAPRAGVLFARGLIVLPITEEEHCVGIAVNIGAVHGDLPDRAGVRLAAVVVEDRDFVPRVCPADRARLGWPQRVRIPDDIIDLGLAEHLVDRHADVLCAPFEYGFADCFTRAHDRAQRERVAPLRLRYRLHHHFQRGGEEKRVPHAILLA